MFMARLRVAALAAAALAAALLALAPPAGAVQMDVQLGPDYDGLESQVCALEGKTYSPRTKTWTDRGLHFTQTDVNIVANGTGILMIMLVRRRSDEKRAVALVRKVLGAAGERHFQNGKEVATLDEYMAAVADSVARLDRDTGRRFAIDYGAVRKQAELDLKGALAAVYIVTFPTGR